MIEKVMVLDANYLGLEIVFPVGHQLDTDSNLVLVAGPNGSGKTAFLRMLATSFDNEKFFRKHGICQQYQWFSEDNLEEISANALKQFKNAKEIFSEESDLNVWGYLKPQIIGGPVYLEFFQAGKLDTRQRPMLIEPELYFQFIPGRRGGHSSGQKLQSETDDFFTKLHSFFETNKAQVRDKEKIEKLRQKKIVDLEEELRNKGEIPMFIEQRVKNMVFYEEIPKNSQLIILMDEPTIFYDYRNKYCFLEKITKALNDYASLQVFIATNDPILIEKANCCRFINLYKQPAESTRKFAIA